MVPLPYYACIGVPDCIGIGSIITFTLESHNFIPINFKGSRSFVIEPQSLDGKIAVASSVTACTCCGFSFIGFLCGCFCQKKRKSSTCTTAAGTVPPSGGQTQ